MTKKKPQPHHLEACETCAAIQGQMEEACETIDALRITCKTAIEMLEFLNRYRDAEKLRKVVSIHCSWEKKDD